LALAVAVAVAPDGTRAEQSASAAIYVRGDTDSTTVISPRLRLRTPGLEDTHVDLVYTVDVWTSASVDIVASASQPVTEQRDEFDLGIDWTVGEDFTLGGYYRYSTEPDYESHGGGTSLDWALADRATTLTWSAGASYDRVGRVGDESFDEEVDTFTTGASLTQVIDASTVVQLLYDLAVIRGYQASAYRFVGLGGDGHCRGTAPFCLPEKNPRERMRHALAVRARRALGTHWSAGAGYRAYLDDWGVVSHTAKADLAYAADPHTTLALTYRFYTQGAADHYQRLYPQTSLGVSYFTSDKELSPLSSHRAALELDRVWELPGGESGLLTGVEVAPTFYQYHDYTTLDRVTAIEVTAVIGMEWP
jgi:hypothetical protein